MPLAQVRFLQSDSKIGRERKLSWDEKRSCHDMILLKPAEQRLSPGRD
jgi:hypothetical protein